MYLETCTVLTFSHPLGHEQGGQKRKTESLSLVPCCLSALSPPGISSHKPRARMAPGCLSPAPTLHLAVKTRAGSHLGTRLTELVVELMQHYSHLPLVPPMKQRTAYPAPQRGTITALPTRKGGRIGLKPITTIRTQEHLSAMPLPLHSMKEAPQGIQTPFLFCLQWLHWLLDVLLLSRRALIISVSLKSEQKSLEQNREEERCKPRVFWFLGNRVLSLKT